MADRIDIETNASQSAADIRDVADAVDDVNASLDKNADANETSAGAQDNFASKAAKAAVALAALKAIIVDTIKAYAEQDALNGQLQRSFRQSGVSAKESAKLFRDAQATFANNAKFGQGIAEQTSALKTLVDTTGDAKQSLEDLKLAVDIQAQADVDLAGATDAVAKARQGDTGALKKLKVLTKDQEKLLASLTDETERSELAVLFLSEAYGGAAEENQGLADNLASNEIQLDRVKVAVGSLVGALWTGSNSFIDGMLVAADILPEGTSTLEAFAGGMEILASSTIEASSALNKFFGELSGDDALAILSGDASFFEVLDRAENKAARARAKKREEDSKINATAKDTAEVQEKSAEDLLKAAIKEQDAKKKSAKSSKSSAKNAEKEARAREKQLEKFRQLTEAAELERRQNEAQELKDLADLEAKERATELRLEALREEDAIKRSLLELEARRTEIINATLDPEQRRLELLIEEERTKQRIASIASKTDEAAKDEKATKAKEKKAKADKTAADAINLSSQAFGAAADLFGAGEREKAGISAAMEAARAIAAAATGNIPGAIGHGIAAAQFGAIAAGAGGGGGGGASSSPVSTAATGSTFDGSASQERALSTETSDGGARGGLTIINNYSSAFPPSPEQERELRLSSERDARRVV